jgi:hypothetical protein
LSSFPSKSDHLLERYYQNILIFVEKIIGRIAEKLMDQEWNQQFQASGASQTA